MELHNIYTVDDIIRQTRDNFFSEEMRRSFSSRVSSYILNDVNKGLVYFITSDQNFNRTKRLYAIRAFDVISQTVITLDDLQGFMTLRIARDVMKSLLD